MLLDFKALKIEGQDHLKTLVSYTTLVHVENYPSELIWVVPTEDDRTGEYWVALTFLYDFIQKTCMAFYYYLNMT